MIDGIYEVTAISNQSNDIIYFSIKYNAVVNHKPVFHPYSSIDGA